MACRISIRGIVQGVGFRPFVYNLALTDNLKGWISNNTNGVEIVLDSSVETGMNFLNKILDNLPPLAYVLDYNVEEVASEEKADKFYIKESSICEGVTFVSPDTSICDDCKRELFDKSHHKYLYPFINCTNCGPRYSIIENIPYDRINTSMKYFEMCDVCKCEYESVTNRRFHAQPNGCHLCGPKIYFKNFEGDKLLDIAADFLNSGKIIGVKGIGGYHIICDAFNLDAVNRVRDFKNRRFKPFALMVKDKNILLQYGINLTKEEEKLFESKISPILIKYVDNDNFKHINPLGKNIGIMKAYTPIHLLLFERFKGDFLIATSGNKKDEPIAIDAESAEKILGDVCDLFIHNNRDIVNRVDDSLVTFIKKAPYILRRSRGYAPLPVVMENRNKIQVAGLGANLKSTICFLKDDFAFISQYVGDLENYETQNFYIEVYNRMKNLFEVEPEVLITDLHPNFFTTKFASTFGVNIYSVQHHVAHMYANMAENNLKDNVIGVIFDGVGLGDDGKIWGGEIFVKKGSLFREIHPEYTPLVGGETAIKNPYRMFLSYLAYFNMDTGFLNDKQLKDYNLIKRMIENNINVIETSSMGRFFEGIGAFLLSIEKNEFEAHSAIALEGICRKDINEFYEFEIIDNEIRIKNIIASVINDFINGVETATIATKFHNTVTHIVLKSAILMREKHLLDKICLSGGVFQNIFLLEKTIALLEQQGFNVFVHKNIPSNDGSISLGQVYYFLLHSEKSHSA
ncbi:carbamoyltransferase HypF [Deferribacteraceae bacterium V6Fe1]|nr:carbamoyltransferase HypF [Deferribacteraceae bacterium V6Fe1]